MNEQLQKFARKTLKDDLSKCSEGEQNTFKRMYGRKLDKRGDPTISIEETLNTGINEVIDSMEEEKLDLAMQQVQRTLSK